MTENDWLAARDVSPLLAHAWERLSERKLLLLLCAYLRTRPATLTSEKSRLALEIVEASADGRESFARRHAALGYLAEVTTLNDGSPPALVERFARSLFTASNRQGGIRETWESRLLDLADLVRDLLGNPFAAEPVVDPAWLAWRGGLVRSLAADTYERHAFEQLPILADALEDAGCTERMLLAHLRSPGPHARGFWALDLLLDRELHLPDGALVLRTQVPAIYRTPRQPIEVEGREFTVRAGRLRFGVVRLRLAPWTGPASIAFGVGQLSVWDRGALSDYGPRILCGVREALPGDVGRLRVTVVDLRSHEADSTPEAFRLAAEHAVQQALSDPRWIEAQEPAP